MRKKWLDRLFKERLAEVLWRLQNEPGEWVIDDYEARHKYAPINVWHENRYYGVDFTYDGHKYGGVTGWSTAFGWAMPWRRKMCRLVDRIDEEQARVKFGDGRFSVGANAPR